MVRVRVKTGSGPGISQHQALGKPLQLDCRHQSIRHLSSGRAFPDQYPVIKHAIQPTPVTNQV